MCNCEAAAGTERAGPALLITFVNGEDHKWTFIFGSWPYLGTGNGSSVREIEKDGAQFLPIS